MAQQQPKNTSSPPHNSVVRNVVATPRESYLTTDEVFAAQYAKAGLQPSDLSGANDNQSPVEQEKERRIVQKQAEYEEYLEAAAYQEQLFEQQQAAFAAEKEAAVATPQSQNTGKAGKAVTQAAAMATNTPTALWMASWHTWAWLSFQVPLALLSIILFGLSAALEQSWLTRQFASLLSVVSLDPKTFFMITHTALWGLSLLGLLATMVTYLLRGQSPLSGNKTTAKVFAVLGCLIGYAIPFLNLFPWIGIYIFVMWTSRD